MWGKAKFGIALLLMLVAFATAPAMQCLGLMASSAQPHSCCHPKPAPARPTVPACCVHSPAVTTQSAEVRAPGMAMASPVVDAAPALIVAVAEFASAPHLDTSPPHLSSILRI